MGDDRGGPLISALGVAPIWMVDVSASVIFPYTTKVQTKFFSGTGSPGWSPKKGRKTVVCVFAYEETSLVTFIFTIKL